jgi:glycerol-3-phosphate dehydrogenase
MVIIGTTDTDFKDHPETVQVTAEDVEYLLHIANQYFPGAQLKASDIISTYAGVRPLVHDGSANESKTSREHTILHDASGITFVAGGKYTTYREMSEEVIDQILKFFPIEKRVALNHCDTEKSFNPYTTEDAYAQSLNETVSDTTSGKLALRYGMEYKTILEKFSQYHSYWQYEACQAIHTTMCLSLVDFYSRRVPLFLSQADHGLSLLNEISEVFQLELELSESEIQKQKDDLLHYMSKELSWRKSFNLETL